MKSGREIIEEVKPKAVDLISVVKILHNCSCQDLSNLIRDSDNGTLELNTESGSSIQVNVEDFASIPIHLLAVLLQSYLCEELFRYLLCGIRLLHTLYDLAPRHTQLEQIMLEDIPLLKLVIDLLFNLVVLLNYETERSTTTTVTLLCSTIAANSLLLFEKLISPYPWDIAGLVVRHPAGGRFLEAPFAAVRRDIEVLRVLMSGKSTNSLSPFDEESIKHLSVQCEVSLKFLHSMCQQKVFRDNLLKHQALCGETGFLLLVRSVLDLDITAFPDVQFVVGAVSRMKSKVLSILLVLCETESISYLDEVAKIPGSLCLAKSVALQVLELLKTLFNGYHKEPSSTTDKNIPKGLLLLNAMRLADIFSDDSNFQSYITVHITEVLTTLFLLPHGEFLSSWCASDLVDWEEDATLDYDPFLASGWVLNLTSSSDPLVITSSEYTFIPCNMPRASYALQRTSLLVKVIANLHCFDPTICKEEKDLFLNKVFECLQREFLNLSNESLSNLSAEKFASITMNLSSLVSHAESLIPSFLNEEDVQLLRKFVSQLNPLMSNLKFELNEIQESKKEWSLSGDKGFKLEISEYHQNAHSMDGCSSLPAINASPDHNHKIGDLKDGVQKNSSLQETEQSCAGKDIDQASDELREYMSGDKDKPIKVEACGLREIDGDAQNVETSGSDSSSTRGKNSIDQISNVQEGEKAGTVKFAEKQRGKRKRTIMNDMQTSIIERALLDKPDMQRHPATLQSWAHRLSEHGSEVTSSQLKNWLNNRKARLARAAKDVRGLPEGDNSRSDKQVGSETGFPNDSSESPVDDPSVHLVPQVGLRDETGVVIPRTGSSKTPGNMVGVALVEGQYVLIVDGQGTEIGKGKVYQAHGKWCGKNLEQLRTCVVDIVELKADKWTRLPYPYEDTGTTFYNAEKQHGVIRVLWDSDKLFVPQQ